MPLSPPACAADSSPQRTHVAFAQTRSTDVDEAYEQEVERADEALRRDDVEAAFRHLERAHVLAQRMTGRHTIIHEGPYKDAPGVACPIACVQLRHCNHPGPTCTSALQKTIQTRQPL